MFPHRPGYYAGPDESRRIPISRGTEAHREQAYNLNRFLPRRLGMLHSSNNRPTTPPRSYNRALREAAAATEPPATKKFSTSDDYEERHKAIDALLRQNLTCKCLPRDRQDWGWYKVQETCHLTDRQLQLLQDMVIHQAEVQGPSAEQSGQTGGYLDGYVSSLQRPRGPYHHPRNPCWTPTELQGMSLGSRYWECKWDDNFV